MTVLSTLDCMLSVELFAILASLPLIALGIISAIKVLLYCRQELEAEQLKKAANWIFGVAFFTVSLIAFIFGLFVSLILNSLNVIYHDSLIYEICSVAFKGLLLVGGIVLLIGGIDALTDLIFDRKIRYFPRNCGFFICVLELFLPTPPNSAPQNVTSKLANDIVGPVNSPINRKELIKKISEQLKTVFIFLLITLWLSVPTSGGDKPIKRMGWLSFAILSIMLLVAYIIWGRKKIPNACLRWTTPALLIGFLWLLYWASEIPYPSELFFRVSVIVFFWVAFLLFSLFLATTRYGIEGRLSNVIRSCIKYGEPLSLPLSIATLAVSILWGWSRLWNAGVREWWIEPVLCLGIIVFAAVFIIYPLAVLRRDK